MLCNSNARSLVPINVARIVGMSSNPARTGYCVSFVALLLAISCNNLQNATAEGDTRTISFHHIHTDEDLTITYKVNGRYDDEALKKINYELRDWRKNETIEMDPRLIDLVWEVHRDVGSTDPIQVVCGYRSPATNAMLRQRSSGVAKFSQHTLGKAMDFYIPGVPLEHLRAVGLYLERGGVGFYPTSGSPFVHLDTGSVRHWPAVAAGDMPRLMAEGHDLHASAENVQTAHNNRPQTVVAALFGGHAAPTPTADAPPAARVDPPHVAAAKPVVVVAAVKPTVQPAPKPKALPATYEVASAESKPVQLRPAQAASLFGKDAGSANDLINHSDYWHGLQGPDPTDVARANADPANAPPRPPAPIWATIPAATVPAATTPTIDTQATASLAPWPLPARDPHAGSVLAYADPTTPVATPRASPMGSVTARPVAPPDTTVALKRSGDRPSVISQPPAPPAPVAANSKTGDRFDDPWLRAMIVSPSAQNFMSASLFGGADYRGLAPLLQKPTTTVMMTFSDDSHPDLSTKKFTGTAVVFVSTVTFNARTASLR
jgi:uncharacterized protein YcbK (DUF882 family)